MSRTDRGLVSQNLRFIDIWVLWSIIAAVDFQKIDLTIRLKIVPLAQSSWTRSAFDLFRVEHSISASILSRKKERKASVYFMPTLL